SQGNSGYMNGAGAASSSAEKASGAKPSRRKGKKAGVPLSANDEAAATPGSAKGAANPETAGDPVTVATGFVIDDTTELSLPGAIPLSLKRLYSSSRFK